MRDDYKHSHSYGNGESTQTFHVEISLRSPVGEQIKKSFVFELDEKIWFSKLRVISEFAKGVKDVFNHGFFELPAHGKAGKFYDEERTFRDYPQKTSHPELEFKYKRRIYKSLQYDGRTLQKVHTKTNLKKLMDSVASNNVEPVRKLLDKGLDPNFQDEKTGETPLTVAVIGDNRCDLIASLVNGGAHLDYRAGDCLTPMHKAAIAGKPDNVKILLDLGCSPNVKDAKGLTPLYYSVLRAGDPYCTELLLNEHADMGMTDHQGMQEIHQACKKGLVQHLEHLVFYGANIDATTSSGNTPLHISAASNHEECARVLLFRGARRDILNYANQSAYEVAAVAGNKELAEFIRRFSDGQIVRITEKPTYSTRRRKVVPKPTASSLFVRTSSADTYSSKSDSSLPPSPRSLTGSHRSSSNADTISLDEIYGPVNGRKERSASITSTTSESSYTSDPEDLSLNERRSQAQKNRTRDVTYPSNKLAPPVKIVSGAASVRKRLYAANASSRRYIAISDYIPSGGGELQLVRGDIVEVLYVGEKGFWEGRVDDRTGWFPSVCVEEIKKGDKVRSKTLFGRSSSLSGMFNKSDDPRAPSVPDHRFIQPPREVILYRGRSGFGFQMRGANCQTPRLNFRPSKEFPALQYIGEVEPGGEADSKGVKNDDFIIEVNNEDVTTATHSHVVNLIKRSGDSVKLKIVTVPPNVVNGVGALDTTDGSYRGGSKVPPPLPQRDPSTTLTLGRMRSSSRPSLYDAGLMYSQEEPASFKMDGVIAISKESPWHTLQRRKPSQSSSRAAAQFKFNTTSRNKPRYRNEGMSSDLRSQSMQNIASLSESYDSGTLGRRPKSTAIPFAIPQIPDRMTRSMSQGENTRPRDYYSNRLDTPSLPARSLSVDESSRYDLLYGLPVTSIDSGEDTIVATPVTATVCDVEETGPVVEARPVYDSNISGPANTNERNAMNGTAVRERKHSLGSSEPFSLSNALQQAVAARNDRINGQNTIDRKISAPANVSSQRRRAHTSANDRLRSDIMSQLNVTQLQTDNYRYHSNDLNPSYHGDVPRRQSLESRSPSHSSPVSSPVKIDPSRIAPKPPMAPKPFAPPPPPPAPPIAPPGPIVAKPADKSSNKPFKGKKLEIPQTAVRQGLITVDALKAKKGNLKTVQNNNDQDTPKSSKSIHSLVGRLAGPSAKPAPAFGGNQHAHLLAKAVAARAARLANEANENEHDSPSSWEDHDDSAPNIPFTVQQKPQQSSKTGQTSQTSPKKTPPPVAPKKSRSPVSCQRKPSETDSPGRRLLYPPRINDSDRSYEYSTEEDRTMMFLDDVIRKEVESENWSLNSWNSSDSSSLAEGVLPAGTCLPNSQDDRPRKSSFGSGSRPWYEYSSGSPSEESLSASSERISHLRSTLSLDEGSRVNGDRLDDLRRRHSDDEERLSSTLTRDNDINLVPVDDKNSRGVSNASQNAVNESYPIDNRSSTDDLSGRYTPTNNATSLDDRHHSGTYGTPSEAESGLMEKIFTTSSGVKVKLLLHANKSPNKNTDIPSHEHHVTTNDFQENIDENTKLYTAKTPISNSNHMAEGLNDFIPPPPMDFTAEDFDEMPSPPLPPPPEFLPVDDRVFNSPLPAPPVDFCDNNDSDAGSRVDVPAMNKKYLNNSGSTFEDKPILEWTCDDVCDWLDHLNLSQYKQTFRDNDIQGLHLPELTKAELLELGIKSLGHRMTMENSVAKLCQPIESSC